MTKKRWFALLGAVILFAFSVVSQIGTSIASKDESNWGTLWGDDQVREKVKEEGASTGKIATIPVNGTIQRDDDSLSSFGEDTYEQISTMLDHAAEDDSVRGVILSVNSPGGGVVESDELHDQIKEIQDNYDKPVYASMESVAASGGYYVSAPADKIVAHPSTQTGSIGVIMPMMDYSELAEDLGIDFHNIKSGKHKDIGSPDREMTDEEEDILQSMIDQDYDEFVQVISEGRDMDEDTVRDLGDGRLYTGKQAKENGLVDENGTLDDTIEMMQEENDLENAEVVEYDFGMGGLDSFFNVTAQKWFGKDDDVSNIETLLEKHNSPHTMYLYSE